MSGLNPWWFGGGIVAIALLIAGGRWLRHFARAVRVERARELFRLQHERYEEMLLAAAAASGKPRGLRWIGCEIIGDALIARTASHEFVALVPVVIQYEPILGSDMEDNPAARVPRTATAIFNFKGRHWHTDGRIVFNLSPDQTLANMSEHLSRVH